METPVEKLNKKNVVDIGEEELPVWFAGQEKRVSGFGRRTCSDDIIFSVLVSVGYDPETIDVRKYVLIECWGDMKRPLGHQDRVMNIWRAWGELKNRVSYVVAKRINKNRGPAAKRVQSRRRRSCAPSIASTESSTEDGYDSQSDITYSTSSERLNASANSNRSLKDLENLNSVIRDQKYAICRQAEHLRQLNSIAFYYEEQLRAADIRVPTEDGIQSTTDTSVNPADHTYENISSCLGNTSTISSKSTRHVCIDEAQNVTHVIDTRQDTIEHQRRSGLLNLGKLLQRRCRPLLACVGKAKTVKDIETDFYENIHEDNFESNSVSSSNNTNNTQSCLRNSIILMQCEAETDVLENDSFSTQNRSMLTDTFSSSMLSLSSTINIEKYKLPASSHAQNTNTTSTPRYENIGTIRDTLVTKDETCETAASSVCTNGTRCQVALKRSLGRMSLDSRTNTTYDSGCGSSENVSQSDLIEARKMQTLV